MKLKVGDWVVTETTRTFGRLSSIDENGTTAYLYTGKATELATHLHGLTKLPIKFKGFEVKQIVYGSWGHGDGVGECRKIVRGDSQARFFTEAVDSTMKLFIGHVGKPYAIKSEPMPIVQARDWLEHQYATLLAKARSLI